MVQELPAMKSLFKWETKRVAVSKAVLSLRRNGSVFYEAVSKETYQTQSHGNTEEACYEPIKSLCLRPLYLNLVLTHPHGYFNTSFVTIQHSD